MSWSKTILRRLTGTNPTTTDEYVSFTCNICRATCTIEKKMMGREVNHCEKCTSNLRWRSVIAALSISLYGKSLAMDDFPSRHDLVGLGMSDWEGYAIRLSRVLAYRNTYYDEEPQLDITAEVSETMKESCDFIISSDVLEHVAPPFEAALRNMKELLRPGGLLVLTVPMKGEGTTDEHYPDLYQYEIVRLGSEYVLVNRTRSADIQVFQDLIFHGGPGATLEMRLFSYPDVLRSLKEVGFVDIQTFDQPVPEHGVLWRDPYGWPIIARAPYP